MRELYLLDGSSYVYRAFHALPRLSTKDGVPTGAVYGFTRMILSLINKKKIKYMGICLDTGAPTFRHQEFPDYKVSRPPMPEELRPQLPKIREVVEAFNLTCFEKEGYEADDILATLACKAEDKYDKIILVSSDKDILQVVTETINVLNPFHSEGLFNPQKVKKTLGVLPEKVPDLLALIGDTIDNIPGISGIGKKTASKLLNEFGSVENVIAYKEKIKRQKIRENIERNSSNVLKNKRLTTLSKTVPMDVNWEELYLKSPDWSRLKKIFEILGFKKFLRELEPTLFS